jgi:hypothetical protein
MDDSLFTPDPDAASGDPGELLDVACPRCGQAVQVRYWGPCPSCRDELVQTLSREGRDVTVDAYEPKMNVTPNQVATKD